MYIYIYIYAYICTYRFAEVLRKRSCALMSAPERP